MALLDVPKDSSMSYGLEDEYGHIESNIALVKLIKKFKTVEFFDEAVMRIILFFQPLSLETVFTSIKTKP
jgi:hypothetical protein